MKRVMVTRYTGQYPGQRTVWFGTCPKWAREFPPDATVTRQRVMVVNPTREACATCGGQHVRLTHPGGAS